MLGKMPRLWGSMGTVFIKNAALGVASCKKTNFSHEAFCLFAVAEIFLEVAIFLETYPVLKNSWLHAWLTTMFG